MGKHRIAIVDDDPGQRQLLDNALERAGFETRLCEEGEAGLAVAGEVDAMVLDVRMPGLSGLEVLARLQESHPSLPVILLTAYMDLKDAVSAMKHGARDYLEKPVDLDELVVAVDEALGLGRAALSTLESAILPAGIVAESPAMQALFRQVQRAATTDATILIEGETGVGKQVVAEFIQRASGRAAGPFVTVDCGALPEHLVESALFGHEKGAFSGAEHRHAGYFEVADGGTLLLDEIGSLPLALQPLLLRVLEAGEYQRVGANTEQTTDVRLIAATNLDLSEAVVSGVFREDLYYRLNVFPVTVPPLRERCEDIESLARQVLEGYGKRLAPATARQLLAYPWPGNVRELKHALERAAILSDGQQVLPVHLPGHIRDYRPRLAPKGPSHVGTMAEIERQAILDALEETGGNKTQAASILGISRRKLVYKLREYGL